MTSPVRRGLEHGKQSYSFLLCILCFSTAVVFIISSMVDIPLMKVNTKLSPRPLAGAHDNGDKLNVSVPTFKDFEDYVLANNSNFDQQCGCRQIKPKLDKNGVKSTCSDHATSRGIGQTVISYSFYGKLTSGYFAGISENLRQVKKFYPNAIMRLYHNIGKIDGLRDLAKLCDLFCANDNLDLCDVHDLDGYGDISPVFGMMWRYAPMADPMVSEFHARDLDSRISPREMAAVEMWRDSGKLYHLMRDHPYHTARVMGGMFGMKLTASNFEKTVLIFGKMIDMARNKAWRKGMDQNILDKKFYTETVNNAMVHDSYLCKSFKSPGTTPWPTRRLENVTNNFVGANGGILTKKCPKECRPKEHQDWMLC